jgi:phosphoenolpyruvate-protein kinase (PTS system EI component)
MGSIAIPRVKKAIQSFSYQEARALVEELRKCTLAVEVQHLLEEEARKRYPELLE